MKSNIKVFLLIFSMLGLFACNKSEDLVTADAKEGGLVKPTKALAYKLGGTPSLDVTIKIPTGPGIETIEVYNKYYGNFDTTESNTVLLTKIEVGSANASADVVKVLTLTYADLIKGLLVNNNPLPADESLNPIGNNWLLTYMTVLSDGRRVVSSLATRIDVANLWAGKYLMSGWVLREGDPVRTGYYKDLEWKLLTNGAKGVKFEKIHLWGDGVETIGGIGKWVFTIDDSAGPNNPMPVTVTDPDNPAVKNDPAYNSRYEPSTKTFYISVYWGTGPTNRAATDTLVFQE